MHGGTGRFLINMTKSPKTNRIFNRLDSLYGHAIDVAVKKYPNLSKTLLLALIDMESGGNPNAVSTKGAEGLLQLMPATAMQMHTDDPFTVSENIQGGAHYLSQLLKHYHGNTDLALAAYNAGESRVDRTGLAHLPLETRNYLDKYHRLMGD